MSRKEDNRTANIGIRISPKLLAETILLAESSGFLSKSVSANIVNILEATVNDARSAGLIKRLSLEEARTVLAQRGHFRAARAGRDDKETQELYLSGKEVPKGESIDSDVEDPELERAMQKWLKDEEEQKGGAR